MERLKAAHWAVMDETRRSGIFEAAEPLQPTATATTVRTEGGKPLITDGPFAETKEQLAGYYILDCRRSRRGDRLGRENSDRVQRRRGLRRNPPDRRPAAALRRPARVDVSCPADIRAAAETVFRREHGRIIASLIRLCGSFDRAEEAMQEGFAAALANWPAAASRPIRPPGSRPPPIAN